MTDFYLSQKAAKKWLAEKLKSQKILRIFPILRAIVFQDKKRIRKDLICHFLISVASKITSHNDSLIMIQLLFANPNCILQVGRDT
jgi:hypothetical protein